MTTIANHKDIWPISGVLDVMRVYMSSLKFKCLRRSFWVCFRTGRFPVNGYFFKPSWNFSHLSTCQVTLGGLD